jgi:hypothetical protein
LAEETGIDIENRMIVRYIVRHSTGTYLSDEAGDLATTAEQLRQKSIQSVKKYSHSPVERRKTHVEKMQ